MKLAPLQRGWTGNRLGGQSIGPPTPNYPDFDCCVIESKVVATMTATKGRYRRFSVVVATGNGQGLCGVGKARALTLQSAVRRAKLCASQNIVPFELKEGRTLWHDGYVCEWNSKIFATPLPEGAGLICHRMIKTLCQVIGIKDMYAKVDGSTTNYQAIARGFLRLLGQQKTYSELASSLGLHVVELRPIEIYLNKTTMTGSNALNPRTTSKKQSGDLPLLAISNPIRHQPHKPKPDEHENFLDDLVDDYDRALEINISELLAAGERDLNALMVGGRVRHHKNANRFQFNGPAAVKRQAERYRYRNQKSVKRQSDAHAALCQPSSSV
ncbi:unnamed protein product [Heterobilharzia americana]|nr:unnamed protein product [Heterobilharzia americana]